MADIPLLQISHILLAKSLSQTAGSSWEENPSLGSYTRAPRSCSVSPAHMLLQEPTLLKNSLLITKGLCFSWLTKPSFVVL